MFSIAVFLLPAILLAEKVERVKSDGSILLDNEKTVWLAGILMDEEAIQLLKVLLQDREVRTEKAKFFGGNKTDSDSVYIYMKTKMLNLPFKDAKRPIEKQIMINEFMLEIGAATVRKDAKFKYKKRFELVEGRARKKGKGVWSYEVL